MLGKILIVNKTDGSVMGWFGEGERPPIDDICLIELEADQYQNEFLNLKNGMASIKVTDIENKKIEFETNEPIKVTTETEVIAQ